MVPNTRVNLKFDTLVHLKVSDCYRNFGGHMTQNGRLGWQNTSIENPELLLVFMVRHLPVGP